VHWKRWDQALSTISNCIEEQEPMNEWIYANWNLSSDAGMCKLSCDCIIYSRMLKRRFLFNIEVLSDSWQVYCFVLFCYLFLCRFWIWGEMRFPGWRTIHSFRYTTMVQYNGRSQVQVRYIYPSSTPSPWESTRRSVFYKIEPCLSKTAEI